MPASGVKPAERFMLWVDAVGGYWVCLSPSVVLGQPGRPAEADIPILADISGRHARIVRDGENYLVEACREVRVDGRPVHPTGRLADGSRIELGSGLRLAMRRPHPLSATARLDFLSPHRTVPAADAIPLMADTCVLGPNPHSHVVCRDWTREVLLARRDDRLYCHTPGPFEIDGRAYKDSGPLVRDSRVSGDGFAFSLEPLIDTGHDGLGT